MSDRASRIEVIDLGFQGTPHVIASFLVHGPAGVVLVETGPSTTRGNLIAALAERGLRPDDMRDVLVTHIHLDHAGDAGWWAQQGACVRVHPLGAPHLVDPSKLLASASRIYGDRMDTLWGEVLPAPAERVVAIADDSVLDIAGLRFRAVETPGHARHHHAWVLGDVAFAGDAAGIRLPDHRWIDLPAPPPEVDPPAWSESLRRLRGLGLRTLYRTHFGPSSNVAAELDTFERVLEQGVAIVAEMLDLGWERERMVEEFSARMRALATAAGANAADARAYELANPRVMSVDGITRYLRRRQPA